MPLNHQTGREDPDQTPIAIPIGFSQPESIESMIARAVRSHAFMEAARRNNRETFDEADDFDVDDDPELKSPYEIDESLPAYKDEDLRRNARKEALERFPSRPTNRPAPQALAAPPSAGGSSDGKADGK